MKKILFVMLMICFGTAHLLGETGEAGFSFLKVGVGPRTLAMGDAGVATAGDPAAMHYNPAALSRSESAQILFVHREWIQDARTEFLGASIAGDRLSLGLAVNSTSISEIEIRTTPGPAQGTFTARDVSLGLSAAYRFSPAFSLGLTSKLLYEKILIDESSGIVFDVGGQFQLPENIVVGASIQNLGSVSELRNESPTVPAITRVGGAYSTSLVSLNGDFTGSIDIVNVGGEGKTHVHAGAELELQDLLAIRFGYQTGYDARSVSAGFGISYGLLRFDYAFVPFRYDLGSTHSVSLLFTFE